MPATRLTVLRLPFFLFLFFLSQEAFAEAAEAPGVSAGTYAQAILALALIVGLLVGTAWLARKVSGGKGFGQGGMRIVGGVALGPRERIVLVEAGDTWLVVGIVPGQIRTLHTMPKGDPLPEGLPPAADKPFAQWLKQVMERRGNA